MNSNEINTIDKSLLTFKITHKRVPWTTQEDNEIITLVKIHSTNNWSLIASELNIQYPLSNRSGKQCRERWHNHLDPSITKNYWSVEEEHILFSKHSIYGNKWSEIAKYLPGRTDNSIKNFFYSKLRKTLRKLVKEMNKDKLFTKNNIDHQKYDTNAIYHIIKDSNLSYENINKKNIIRLIVDNVNNSLAYTTEEELSECQVKSHRQSNDKIDDDMTMLINNKRKRSEESIDSTITIDTPLFAFKQFGIIDLRNKIIINNGEIITQRNDCLDKKSLSIISEADTASLYTINNEGINSCSMTPMSAFGKVIF